jgi:hypothetical protein
MLNEGMMGDSPVMETAAKSYEKIEQDRSVTAMEEIINGGVQMNERQYELLMRLDRILEKLEFIPTEANNGEEKMKEPNVIISRLRSNVTTHQQLNEWLGKNVSKLEQLI